MSAKIQISNGNEIGCSEYGVCVVVDVRKKDYIGFIFLCTELFF